MRTPVPLTEKQRKAMLPHKEKVGQMYRTLDWLKDSILNQHRQEFDTALNNLRHQLAEIEAVISF